MSIVSRFLFPGILLALALATVATFRGPAGARHVAPPTPARDSGISLAPPYQIEIIRLRDAAKIRVAAQVLAGELDLFEAAAHFRQINHEPPELVQLGYRLLPGATDEEKLCREVIQWVKFRHPRRASHAEVARAVACLENVLASRGGVGPTALRKSAGGKATGEGDPMSERTVPMAATPG